MEPVDNCHFVQGDFNSLEVERELATCAKGQQANVVMSDMLHSTTGHKDTDHYRSIEICLKTIDFCVKHLGHHGNLVCKFLRGSDDKELIEYAKQHFKTVQIFKPKSSRQESSESYLLACSKIKAIATASAAAT